GETSFRGELLDSQGNPFDPLEYAVSLARERNLEIHAWLNPYRVTHLLASYTGGSGIKLTSTGEIVSSLEQVRREWEQIPNTAFSRFGDYVKIGESRYVLDPGLPGARQWITERVIEVVSRYDIDAIQFDDYFYPNNYDDRQTFLRYNTVENNRISGAVHPDTALGHANWRRENTEMLIRDVSEAIKEVVPWVKFGISPGGVWLSAEGETGLDGGGFNSRTGSASTTSWTNFHSSYADTRRWVIEDIIDYITPQIYWDWSHSTAPYGAIADWWGRLVFDYGVNGSLRNSQGEHTNTQVFIGVGIYRLEGNPPAKWSNATGYDMEGLKTLLRQEHYNIGNPNISGSMFFTQNHTRPNRQSGMWETMQALQNTAWRYPALVPPMPHLGGIAPRNPENIRIEGNYLVWDNMEDSTDELVRPRYFVVYHGDTPDIDLNNPRNIAAIVAAGSAGANGALISESDDAQYSWRLPEDLRNRYFMVTAVNRLHDESRP
ncbi:MAG: family 10 glycosylhydrolase, partial [Defluviitaleaceae bacterium]|nr:family 10 glycosylhydrolase [Defluviitaleaceae bacterium]